MLVIFFQGEIRNNGGSHQEAAAAQGQSVSIFSVLNDKLKAAGLSSFNIGDHVIEPIVYIGFLAAFLLLGVKGLLLGLVLFFFVNMSSNGGSAGQVLNSFFGGNTNQGRGDGGDRPPTSRSSGHRLGRN